MEPRSTGDGTVSLSSTGVVILVLSKVNDARFVYDAPFRARPSSTPTAVRELHGHHRVTRTA